VKEEDLTGYCGLYCGDCIRYRCRASELADELLKEIDNVRFAEYANVKRTHTGEFEDFHLLISSLRAISEINCKIPCRLGGDGCGGSCEIIRCVGNRSLQGCWECDDFEGCNKFDFLRPFHGDANLKNLRRIRELGINGWAKAREKCYPWL
jgi:hypothetical protein